MKHEIEIFTSGCYLCRETMEIVEKAKCGECTLTEYNLAEKCESEICLDRAKKYGIKTTPTIVVDGRIAIEGKPTVEEVKKVLGL
ncbi:MAG: thioredoxin family protein [Candidatus Methanoperedenaceae archaeon]|nr:thioredoxin family protein [Candidatus Methanoperedenaceae archaeon]